MGLARVSEKDFCSSGISLWTDYSSLTSDLPARLCVFFAIESSLYPSKVYDEKCIEVHSHSSLKHVQILEPEGMGGKRTNKQVRSQALGHLPWLSPVLFSKCGLPVGLWEAPGTDLRVVGNCILLPRGVHSVKET